LQFFAENDPYGAQHKSLSTEAMHDTFRAQPASQWVRIGAGWEPHQSQQQQSELNVSRALIYIDANAQRTLLIKVKS
jgi:hypothetical protein